MTPEEARKLMSKSKRDQLENLFAEHWARRWPMLRPLREYVFAPPRKWRFDFAWPECKLAVEIEGATWRGGRHNHGTGLWQDAEKYNEASLLGWRVLRFISNDVKRRPDWACQQVERGLGLTEATP